jgi:hypothetical protein
MSHKEPIPFEDFLNIYVGDTVFYLLRPEEQPTEPDREWKGNVIAVHHASEHVRVQVIEEGYEGYENIKRLQIVGFEKKDEKMTRH